MPRSVSPVFAGREQELQQLVGAFNEAAAGMTRVCFLSAEAGGGKSRLARELAMRIRDRAQVIEGGCPALCDSNLPYAPFIGAVRQLLRSVGIEEIRARVGESGVRELALLLPDFGVAHAHEGDRDIARGRFFEVMLNLFERAASPRPLLLIIEDLHWADSSTRDLLSFLVRNLDAPVLIVATFRSGNAELHSLLTELQRVGEAVSLILPPLTSDETAVQLQALLGQQPDAALVAAVHRRSGGIPLFTEALIGAEGNMKAGLPESLRDVLLSTVKELPDPTQDVLRAAALCITRIDHRLLAAVLNSDDETLTQTLRPAVAANILVSGADCYSFRHDLFRDAIDSNLLAGERIRLHRAFAAALEADPTLSPDRWISMRLAAHWRSAGDHERALRAAWRAASDAATAFAYPEELHMLEQVLDLWQHVRDPSAYTQAAYVDVVERAADVACWAVETDRGALHVETALHLRTVRAQGQVEGERIAALLLQRAAMRQQTLHPATLADLWAAVNLARRPTRTRAEALGQLCRALMIEGRYSEAAPPAAELTALAQDLGNDEFRIEATIIAAQLRAADPDERLREFEQTRAEARRNGSGRVEVLAYMAIADVLDQSGDHIRGVEVGRIGMQRASYLGQARYRGVIIAHTLARAQMFAGRWDEALEVIEEALSLDPKPFGRAPLLICRAEIAVRRGDLATAEQNLGELRSLADGPETQQLRTLPLDAIEIEYLLEKGDVSGAIGRAAKVLSIARRDEPRYLWPLLNLAARACTEGQRANSDRELNTQAQKLRPLLDEFGCELESRTRLDRAHAAVFAAERFGANDVQSSAASWSAAAALWRELDHPYPLAYALMRAAMACLALDRDASATQLQQAAEIATELAAKSLLAQINSFAKRSRVGGVEHEQTLVQKPFDLTRRELEVLRLVSAGHNNRQIADALFISVKTASVHVSNILSKLGVASRGVAAATAHKLHLFD